MDKIAIITDTTSDLTEEFIRENNINVLPFRIIYKDREYKDKYEITPEEVYEGLSKEIPTSSMPSMDDMEKVYEKLEAEGYTHAIALVLSSGLSGIYNGMQVVAENHPAIKTFLCDTHTISMGEGLVAMECAKMVKQGKSFEEITARIPSIQDRIHVFFVVGTLEYLKKGGRIGKVSGTIAELLNIKPIIAVDHKDGRYFTYDKVRGRKQSLNKIVEIARGFAEKKCSFHVLHGYAEEDARKVMENLKEIPNVASVEWHGCISPVSGVHSGPGLIGLVIMEEEE